MLGEVERLERACRELRRLKASAQARDLERALRQLRPRPTDGVQGQPPPPEPRGSAPAGTAAMIPERSPLPSVTACGRAGSGDE